MVKKQQTGKGTPRGRFGDKYHEITGSGHRPRLSQLDEPAMYDALRSFDRAASHEFRDVLRHALEADPSANKPKKIRRTGNPNDLFE